MNLTVPSLSPRRPIFESRLAHVGFEVDNITLKENFLRVLRLCPINNLPQTHHILSHMYDGCYGYIIPAIGIVVKYGALKEKEC
jgi:hypothetical protein